MSWRYAALILLAGCGGLRTGADAGPDGGPDSGEDAGDSGYFDAGPDCDAGFHDCAGTCAADDSVDQCGPACVHCDIPANSAALCTGGGCDFVCSSPLFRCGNRCCKAIAVTAGYQHSCALTELGTVKCWGTGSGVGDGTFFGEHLVSYDVPVGGDAGVAQISASFFNTCARLTSGGLRCWGNNANGSLGDGTLLPRGSPVEVLAQGVDDISLGAFFGCARIGESIQCWGAGTQGQLGDGMLADRSSPGPVSGLVFGATGLWAGYNTTCASSDAGFRCWGSNGTGQCGDIVKAPAATPVAVKAVDAGIRELHPTLLTTCALTDVGGVKCFGSNIDGQCGDGTMNGPRLTSVDALGLGSGVTQLAGGSAAQHFCAIVDGGAWCWGLNDKGQVGDGTVVAKHQPTPVFGLSSGVVSIATGEKHSCAVTAAGGVLCWGVNDKGQLGEGTKKEHWIPFEVH